MKKSFNNAISIFKEMTSSSKDESFKAKNTFENCKKLSTALKASQTFVVVATKSTSVNFFVTVFELKVLALAVTRVCGLVSGSIVLNIIV